MTACLRIRYDALCAALRVLEERMAAAGAHVPCTHLGGSVWAAAEGWGDAGGFCLDENAMRCDLAVRGVRMPDDLMLRLEARRQVSLAARYSLVGLPPETDAEAGSLAHESGVGVAVRLSGGSGAARCGIDVVDVKRIRRMLDAPRARDALLKRSWLGHYPSDAPPQLAAAWWGVKEAAAKAAGRNELYTAPHEVDVEAPEDLLEATSRITLKRRAAVGVPRPAGIVSAAATKDGNYVVTLAVLCTMPSTIAEL
eukprot:TRINITY_DN29898_c0_g1_i1.p1 TRINITY_DN29898_c0_g1~~TRINITY_DN29898_c0_g1_i1.p1  ORF type:complete len:254 (+),score=28.12 TRINITY_DN29898_c0_g1_i1:126-887(+)